MAEEAADHLRSIRFPLALWARIDADAERCRRSSVKQMETVLSVYYGLDDDPAIDISRFKKQTVGVLKEKAGS